MKNLSSLAQDGTSAMAGVFAGGVEAEQAFVVVYCRNTPWFAGMDDMDQKCVQNHQMS